LKGASRGREKRADQQARHERDHCSHLSRLEELRLVAEQQEAAAVSRTPSQIQIMQQVSVKCPPVQTHRLYDAK
jgi:hypothetical protein